PLRSFKDWRNDFWASPEGYYNDYYGNPYFLIDNYRQKTRNDYLTGTVELNWKPIKGLDVLYRVGFSTRNNDASTRNGVYVFSDPFYLRGGKASFSAAGGNSESMGYSTQLLSDFMVSWKKNINDISIELIGGNQIRNNVSKSLGGSTSG